MIDLAQEMDSDSETEFLYPSLSEPATVQPYMFERLPQSQRSGGRPSGSSDQESEDEDINAELIGLTDW